MPKPTTFSNLDIILCFLLLNQTRSRSYLTKKLALGEGSIWTILDNLKQKTLIVSSKQGHTYSNLGKQLSQRIRETISTPKEIRSKSLTNKFFPLYKEDKPSYTVLKTDKKIEQTHILRDLAIKEGCDGALILKIKNTRIMFPESDYQDNELSNIIKPKQDGILIITIAKTVQIANKGIIQIINQLEKDIFNGII